MIIEEQDLSPESAEDAWPGQTPGEMVNALFSFDDCTLQLFVITGADVLNVINSELRAEEREKVLAHLVTNNTPNSLWQLRTAGQETGWGNWQALVADLIRKVWLTEVEA